MSNVAFVTCDLLDDHPDLDIQVVIPSLDGKFFKSYGARKTFGGEVVTVKCFEDNSRVKELLATDGTGKVLVVDGGASMRCALIGDMIAESAVKNHWNGVIIYGCVRDVDAIAELDLGVHALAAIPQKSNRKGVGEVEIEISFGNVSFNSGDFVYADNNGIVVSKTKLVDL
ncbi:ribonuclease E activity regulator RraA [Acinetobacter portensis]|uniref:4-hydroxy-4-methyl-2-oxoglutarate aldolase n=1 Tax=Acinetobacter portensis TaxID=1839785 RepID=A0ABY4JSB8_9GAMM|nr:ribonuclease E activity regulator RraA [Acinetobacter portensis]MCK7609096.1 ribonuclease E activity regulator RraA [Acinetobacter portensis]MCK7639910.1 ribonuclease E activity regulator RraA [Acinetobacter portensis]UPO22304.1 ribonuclease E activity regulator RraA [Acinetobacter portensis]